MKLVEVNQEIISLEFQFGDATAQINESSLLPSFDGDKNIALKSIKSVGRAIELNGKLIKLLGERELALKKLLPEQPEDSENSEQPEN